ncbi:MAG: endonuclease/exonuclease/phosphatase family protein [Sediminicola sp.]
MAKVVFALNILFSLCLLFCCLAPYISLERLPLLFIFSLTVPYLVAVNLFFLLYWLFSDHKRYLWLSLFSLVFAYLVLGTFYKFGEGDSRFLEGDLSILTFNSQGFHGNSLERNPQLSKDIVDFITKQDADIICFQEFDYAKIRSKDFKQYAHKYVNFEFGVNSGKVIQAIYSKYPIVGKGAVEFPKSGNNALYADIAVEKDTVRVYNLHLQSLKVRPSSLRSEESQKLLKRLSTSFVKQQQQAELVREHAAGTDLKKIICGDFNNSQYSSVYADIKGDMADSFMEMGKGYGRTYMFKFLPLRIDFIFVDPSMQVMGHKNFDQRLSDHFPVMASVRLH